MSKSKSLAVSDLSIDLQNYRHTPQKDEVGATNSLIAIKPEWFWALLDSLVEEGYQPTENIIVLQSDDVLEVREGNRRTACLKIIHGLLPEIDLPDDIVEKIKNLSADWKKENANVPCIVYDQSESPIVDRLVARIHGKSEKSGRDEWNSVARARLHRTTGQAGCEPGLDLLEKFLARAKNLTANQRERWSGDYSLTVLDEALKKAVPLLGDTSARELSSKYPASNKQILENICLEVGTKDLTFPVLRAVSPPWHEHFGLELPSSTSPEDKTKSESSSGNPSSPANNESLEDNDSKSASSSAPVNTRGRNIALPIDDPKTVRRKIRNFKPRGEGREKIAAIRTEMMNLWVNHHPLAFCFLLRSAFEISAKAYCADHKASGGPSPQKSGGMDKNLAVLLGEIHKHMSKQGKDRAVAKKLHGAMTELGKPNGILSVTSLNQLIHSQSFSLSAKDICITFSNLFPFLEELNN